MDGGILAHSTPAPISQSGCIELVDGNLFDPLRPDPALMSLEVITFALANSTRFAGQIRKFYSTGQHSVLVALLTDQDMRAQRCALLHDADEAFGLPDLATPIKPFFPEYVAAQKRIGRVVDGRYGITRADHVRTKPADTQALLIEKLALKDRRNARYWQSWSSGVSVPDWVRITPLSPDAALALVEDAMKRVFEDNQPISRSWIAGRQGFILT